MTSKPEISRTAARVRVNWSWDLSVTPGSVPDRYREHAPSIRARRGLASDLYQPDRVHMVFGLDMAGDELDMLTPGSLIQGPARRSITLDALTLSGHRIRQDGSQGARVSEPFGTVYGDAPDWVQPLVRDALFTLSGIPLPEPARKGA